MVEHRDASHVTWSVTGAAALRRLDPGSYVVSPAFSVAGLFPLRPAASRSAPQDPSWARCFAFLAITNQAGR